MVIKVNYRLLVNKTNGLSKDFIPEELVDTKSEYKEGILINEEVLNAFRKLQNDAKLFNYSFDIESGYRSYDYQEKIYNELVKEKGFNYALRSVAKPGRSEHQTGLAIDICIYKEGKCYIENDIEDFPETKWLHSNCHKYGFILRYPKDKEEITEYMYEPWHLRYVGDIAPYIYNNDLTLEEYYDITKKNLDNY